MLLFPTLSRQPALKTRESTIDPTLRDSLENGMETTRARFTRQRREWEASIEYITPADKEVLNTFVVKQAVFGANIFGFPDPRDPVNPRVYQVRFSTLPAYSDAGNVEGEFRQSVQFGLREV